MAESKEAPRLPIFITIDVEGGNDTPKIRMTNAISGYMLIMRPSPIDGRDATREIKRYVSDEMMDPKLVAFGLVFDGKKTFSILKLTEEQRIEVSTCVFDNPPRDADFVVPHQHHARMVHHAGISEIPLGVCAWITSVEGWEKVKERFGLNNPHRLP